MEVPKPTDNSLQRNEIVIAFVGALGTDLELVAEIAASQLTEYGYNVISIRVSEHILKELNGIDDSKLNPYQKITTYMDAGDKLRKVAGDSAVLAYGIATRISKARPDKNSPFGNAYIVRSLKTPDEVRILREIYGKGFFLFGVSCEQDRRQAFLVEKRGLEYDQAAELIKRDYKDNDKFGQDVSDTFHLSDIFVFLSKDHDLIKEQMRRSISLIFGNPHETPTFEEYSMYLAFAASLRSADLSRQVGAVVAKDFEVLSTGANEVPSFGGGLYWNNDPLDANPQCLEDGRDAARGVDNNKVEQLKIIDRIVADGKAVGLPEDKLRSVLAASGVKYLTEFMRPVHAEMEAILACGRNGISTRGSTLYCTTFPCHNCAKHIIAAGLSRVVFVEPYPKSRAAAFHDDAIVVDPSSKVEQKVVFKPFVGIGPRRYFDIFSMSVGSGNTIRRKDNVTGRVVPFVLSSALPKLPNVPFSYIQLEAEASERFSEYDKPLTAVTGGPPVASQASTSSSSAAKPQSAGNLEANISSLEFNNLKKG